MPHEEAPRKIVRRLRHWKQRFNKNAEFIWRRPTVAGGVQYNAGDLIPDTLKNNPAKLRSFWEAKRIELADFEAPNVATGQVEEVKVEEENDDVPVTLVGSSELDDEYEIGDEVIPAGDIVVAAFENTELTIAEWNALPDDEREALIAQSLEWMTDEGDEPEEEFDPLA